MSLRQIRRQDNNLPAARMKVQVTNRLQTNRVNAGKTHVIACTAAPTDTNGGLIALLHQCYRRNQCLGRSVRWVPDSRRRGRRHHLLHRTADRRRGGANAGAGPPPHGLPSNTMALITTDCDAMRFLRTKMALITSDCVTFRRH